MKASAYGLLPLLLLSACTVPAAQEDLYWWRLVAIDGQPFAARALIAYPKGRTTLVGQGPCNRFSATRITSPFPTDRITNIVATEMACSDLAEEQRFFTALSEMERMGVSVSALSMVNDAGRRMDFVPDTR
jgi:heat shock protein HslJ